jgi:dienelactone hydrolase
MLLFAAAATCAGADLPRRALQFSGSTAAEARAWEKKARAQLATAVLGGQMPVRVPLDVKETNAEHRTTYDIIRVTYRSTETRTNYALVAVPKGGGKKPAIVALHGHESTWGQADLSAFSKGNLDDFCDYFAERGFVVVFPAVLDHGASAGDRPLVGIWVWDALRCVDYLAGRPGVDAGRIGCVGLSTGGMLALYLAALDVRIAATVSAGYFTTWNYLETALKAPPHCLDGQLQIRGLRENLDICDIAGLIAPRPLMLMHGRKDVTFCPGADATAMDSKWQRRVMDTKEFEAALAETRRVYSAFDRKDQLRMYFHPGGHGVDNPAAFGWIADHFEGGVLPAKHAK